MKRSQTIHVVAYGCLAALFATPPGVAFAKTLTVPEMHSTIQAAVSAADSGDTVLVAPGRYKELILMKNGVVLRAAAERDSTILEIPGIAESLLDERLIECREGIGRSTVIEGFRFESGGIRGACIWCEKASPTIRGNHFSDFGWAINLREGSNALIEDNVIVDNRTFGLAIFASSPEVRRNTFRGNVPRAISITGRRSKPVIGGRPEYANRIFENEFAIVNDSRNDIDATHNDWGWATTVEMERLPYPADISVFMDGNDAGESHRGRGKVDYRNWIRPEETDAAPAAGGSPGSGSDSASVATPAAAEAADVPAAPGGQRWIVPAAVALGLVAVFAIVSRRSV